MVLGEEVYSWGRRSREGETRRALKPLPVLRDQLLDDVWKNNWLLIRLKTWTDIIQDGNRLNVDMNLCLYADLHHITN